MPTPSRVPGCKFAKKGSPHATVTYAEAVEVALCYGWIDGQAGWPRRGLLPASASPRARKRSKWSQINVEKVDQA